MQTYKPIIPSRRHTSCNTSRGYHPQKCMNIASTQSQYAQPIILKYLYITNCISCSKTEEKGICTNDYNHQTIRLL